MAIAESVGLHVLVIPYPAQGHMLSLLDLAHLLSSRARLAVTVAVTTKNRPLLDPLLSRSPDVVPLVLPFPDYPALPPGLENSKDLRPAFFRHLIHALAGLREPLLRWARSTPHPPIAIISDMFLGWTTDLAAELGVPRLVFSPSGALAVAITNVLWRRMPQRSNLDDHDCPISFPEIPGSPVFPWRHLSMLYRTYKQGDPISEFIKEGLLSNNTSWGFVFNTFSDLEMVYLDRLRKDLGNPRVWAVGPLAQPDGPAERGGVSSAVAGEIMEWLDGCPEDSVVLVCFGSQKVLAPPQAAGLERSGARFVWCARGATAVPVGFEGRVAGRGLVVREWAPQVAILGHPAVAAFLTHCGWNSVLEAVAAGVAVLTWPMGADQFANAKLVVEEAGVGVALCDGGDAVPDPDEVARVVAESLGQSGKELSNRAKELSRKALAAVKKGGNSFKELDEMVAELSKLRVK
ncbi:UDP-glycosyltransferase 89B2-like [Phoenix dactylifera]|uniref:UDP-glycosyltransferase 89B2-like n=1 Tax=Phoenix dactylifera TaxID=42345 RepID=A0A8B8ZV49_PHODC|nr:UDP-glycosyltransferase 89B2-like [Phoenix dactylifera]